jgi:adenylate cyclase
MEMKRLMVDMATMVHSLVSRSTHKLPGALSQAWAVCMVLLLALGALAFQLLDPMAIQGLRLAQFDQFQRWHPRPYVPGAVRIIDIDETSLKAYGQWPWPRDRLAQLVDRLHGAGVTAIAFDVLLTEPDRTAPNAMAQLWHNPQATAVLAHLPDPDTALAVSLVNRPTVLGSNLLRGDAADGAGVTPTTPMQPTYRIISSGDGKATAWLQDFDSAVRPLPSLVASARGVGALNAAPDSDGVVRRVPLLLRVGTDVVPSLSAEALRVAQGSPNYFVRGHADGVQDVRIGNLTVPTNARGEIWLHYTENQPDRFISAARVLDGTTPPAHLSGQIVLVGSSAAGLMDLRTNPFGQQMPGVLAHAQALEQMLLGQHLQRPAWATALEALATVLGTLLIGLIALGAPTRWATLALGIALSTFLGAAWYAFVYPHLLLDAANPAAALLLTFGLASGAHQLVSERQQRWLRTAFSRYVSPNRVEHLVAHPEQLHLGGRRQVCSFVFTDLVGFTPMLEASDPAQLVSKLNDYLEAMLTIVFRHEGTLDRFVGDAMVVLFSAPVTQTDHQQRALNCALEMDAFATAYAKRLQHASIRWGLTRIGVHCGEVIVGNFGGKTLFDYRALGDPINTAARLESVNKHLGTRMCVSQDLLDGCTGVPVRAVGRVVLKGKRKALQVSTPDAALDTAACAPASDYAAALRLLQDGPARDALAARAQFEALAQRFPQDPLVTLHLRRLRDGATDDVMVMGDK